jgi:hypothetical protein
MMTFEGFSSIFVYLFSPNHKQHVAAIVVARKYRITGKGEMTTVLQNSLPPPSFTFANEDSAVDNYKESLAKHKYIC